MPFHTADTIQILFVISSPDVYKSGASDTYVVFGRADVEDISSQALGDKAKEVLPEETFAAAGAQEAASAEAKPAAAAPVEEEGEVDETGVEAKDIELVMSQTNVTRAQAVAALKKNDGDIVNAIMV